MVIGMENKLLDLSLLGVKGLTGFYFWAFKCVAFPSRSVRLSSGNFSWRIFSYGIFFLSYVVFILAIMFDYIDRTVICANNVAHIEKGLLI